MNKFVWAAAMAAVAVLAYGAGVYFPSLLTTLNTSTAANAAKAEREPLYWVAPMDASFRRDGPGKSPMGMDLVPVYAKAASSQAGAVRIAPEVQQNLGLRTAQATLTTMARPITAVGFVGFNRQALRHFHLRASGWVSELSVVSEGDPVRKGQKLFEFYSPEILNTQQEYLSALKGNRPALAQSAKLKLVAQGVSEREIGAITRERQLRPQLSYYAERDGYVAAIDIVNGSYVQLEQNTLSVGTLNNVWVTAEVFERSAGLLQKGQAVNLTSRSYPGQQWRGEVDYVYPVLNAANRTAKVRIVLANNNGRLKPNMLMDLVITTASQTALTIPSSAVIRTGQATRVVRQVDDQVFRSVMITTGHSGAGKTTVLDGLSEGDRVVVNAQFLIDSESHVEAELDRIDSALPGGGDHHPDPSHEGVTHPGAQHKTMPHGGMDHSEMDHSGMDHSAMDHSAMDHGAMDHSEMDHSKMDHGAMDHSEMDHSGMDHSGMDHSDMGHSGINQSAMQHDTTQQQQVTP
jgi:Cu(I)/Ag(I) efflux system membrane fusion protein